VSTLLNRIALCTFLAAASWPVAAGEALSGRVSPQQGFAPSDVVVQLRIEPNELNRAVVIEVESAFFYTSSEQELDGDRAPRSKFVRFRALPAGEYEVRVTLLGARGERASFTRPVVLQ
jgi:hypothetical protein